jgi:hypothetical protein
LLALHQVLPARLICEFFTYSWWCSWSCAENWRYVRDSKGRITHTVDIQADSAQDVLNALQAAIFTGKLPECSLQVRLTPHHVWATGALGMHFAARKGR